MNLQSSTVVKNPYDRIRNHSPKSFNKAIDKKTDAIMESTIQQGSLAIKERLKTLDKEWDIDRALMLLFSGGVSAQLATAMGKKNKNWLWGPLIQSSFLMLHATLGWCPPVPLLRKLGFRTRFEIQAEREELLEALRSEENQEKFEQNFSITEWGIYETI